MATHASLEAQTEVFLSELNGWSQASLCLRPSATGWSALQVVEHLVKTEEEILVQAKEGARNPHRIGLRDRLGFAFILQVFRTDRKVKTPGSAEQVLPGPELALDHLRGRWRETRSEFQIFQEQLTSNQARLGLFRHPVAGWMGMGQIQDFFQVHLIHHGFQIKRLRSFIDPASSSNKLR